VASIPTAALRRARTGWRYAPPLDTALVTSRVRVRARKGAKKRLPQQACLLTSGPLSGDRETRLQGRAEGILRKELAASSLGTLAMLFRICRQGVPKRWVVLLEEGLYGEYIDKDQALLDAVEAATDVREAGQQVEVWDQIRAVRVY
jgi:hypothetical protein